MLLPGTLSVRVIMHLGRCSDRLKLMIFREIVGGRGGGCVSLYCVCTRVCVYVCVGVREYARAMRVRDGPYPFTFPFSYSFPPTHLIF